MNAHPWQLAHSDNRALTPRQAGRLAAALYLACGVVTALSPFLPSHPDLDRNGVLSVGFIALGIGAVAWVLPWHRWGRWASALLIPVAHGLIALHNYWGGDDPYRYGLFFMVAFMWVGVAQPRWTSLLLAPTATAAYLTPLVLTDHAPWALASAIYAIPVFVIVGEATAWVAARLAEARADLRLNEDRFRSLVQNSSDGIAVVDETGAVTYASPAVGRILGHSVDNVLGRPGFDFVHADDLDKAHEVFGTVGERPGASEVVELRARHKDGSWRWLQTTVTNLVETQSVAGVLVNFRDITERRQLEERLAYQAYHDQLTGLPNRRLLRDRAGQALARAERTNSPLSLLFIDLDGFKDVNDTLGHDTGDRLLCSVADRIRAVVRPADTVARLGGDEFGVLLEDASHDEAEAVAERVLAVLTDPFLLVGSAVEISASIGIGVVQGPKSDVDDLLRDADAAMYTAKASGGARSLLRART